MINTSSDNPTAIGRKLRIMHRAVVLKRKQQTAIFAVPHPCGVVIAGSHNTLAIWGKPRTPNLTRVALEDGDQSTINTVPNTRRLVRTRSYNPTAVRRECNVDNLVRVAAECG